jgi:hypothetical protein
MSKPNQKSHNSRFILFEWKLVVTAISAFFIIYYICKAVNINISFVYQVATGVFIYFIGIVKNQVIPFIIDKKIETADKNSRQLKDVIYRLELLEDRIDKITQVAFKAEAALDVSALDKTLEQDRIQSVKIKNLEGTIDKLTSSYFWRQYIQIEYPEEVETKTPYE